ncbi:MAG TPA: hypothetical protein VHW01_02570 [Polyangiaceae bacterium]|jgi:hypothetical protein|nr:hypothetical protein [Polyangiaceae bacterium]
MKRGRAHLVLLALAVVASVSARSSRVFAQSASTRHVDSSSDGVYDRFDGDLDLGLGLGAELGSAGHAAPAIRASAHYFSIAGVYLEGRVHARDASARSLFGLGVDLRPLFVPRWAKGFETGPSFMDLTLDSLSLSLGAFWSERPAHVLNAARGLEAGSGFGVPLFASAGGPWLEARGVLRYPDGAAREEALFFALSWHGFVLTPLSAGR